MQPIHTVRVQKRVEESEWWFLVSKAGIIKQSDDACERLIGRMSGTDQRMVS
jgi:hypothetical protein